MTPDMTEVCQELPPSTMPWLEDWPAEGLEAAQVCPICSSAQRVQLYHDLVDNIFKVAPGRWTLYQCLRCGSAYLDPRPTLQSIELAYRNYYTHDGFEARPSFESLSFFLRLRRILANGYTNWRFGTRLMPASRIGIAVAWLVPGMHRVLDQQLRYLPVLVPGARLLDVGCGSGAFLERATAAGWHASGVELDEKAAANARARGLNVVQGDIGCLAESEKFDAVTLTHVIEHMHDPLRVLREVFHRLKPGGTLYLETPNIDSLGRQTFGRNWRGLEPPRHLVIFCRRSILQALESVGFSTIHLLSRPHDCAFMFRESRRITSQQYSPAKDITSADLTTRLAALKGRIQRSKQEFIALVAIKGNKR